MRPSFFFVLCGDRARVACGCLKLMRIKFVVSEIFFGFFFVGVFYPSTRCEKREGDKAFFFFFFFSFAKINPYVHIYTCVCSSSCLEVV